MATIVGDRRVTFGGGDDKVTRDLLCVGGESGKLSLGGKRDRNNGCLVRVADIARIGKENRGKGVEVAGGKCGFNGNMVGQGQHIIRKESDEKIQLIKLDHKQV
ncbi:hypothetical protein DPMN_161418 [Dreissena polymorpha]|uniref:Uncharacterized protein n=1 Tax=Dreissena polymorpha TaxID=45954 RepID=A0A9D4ET03_DREPO|nr:hypothetical protein DPMN_161418 [Dreissena polymorpha]